MYSLEQVLEKFMSLSNEETYGDPQSVSAIMALGNERAKPLQP